MNSDETSRNMHYSSNRKPNQSKGHVYSPSTNYNYGGNQNMHGNHSAAGYGNQQHHQRRKPNQFKRDGYVGAGDRLAKQNDIIIKLLKEIRDRLPPPPQADPAGQENENGEALLQGEAAFQQESREERTAEQSESFQDTSDDSDATVDEIDCGDSDTEVNGNV